MTFQALHDMAREKGVVVVRISDNAIPTEGYAIWLPLTGGISGVRSDVEFDSLVRHVVTHGNQEHIMVTHDDVMTYVQPAMVFHDRQYAMGYLHGSGSEFGWDIAHQRKLTRR